MVDRFLDAMRKLKQSQRRLKGLWRVTVSRMHLLRRLWDVVAEAHRERLEDVGKRAKKRKLTKKEKADLRVAKKEALRVGEAPDKGWVAEVTIQCAKRHQRLRDLTSKLQTLEAQRDNTRRTGRAESEPVLASLRPSRCRRQHANAAKTGFISSSRVAPAGGRSTRRSRRRRAAASGASAPRRLPNGTATGCCGGTGGQGVNQSGQRRRRGCDVDISLVNRGDTAAATWTFRGEESRRRRGSEPDRPWRSDERGRQRHWDIWARLSTPLRPRRGDSAETSVTPQDADIPQRRA